MWCRVVRYFRALIVLAVAFAVLPGCGRLRTAAAPARRAERVFIPGVGEMDLARAEALAAQIHDGPRQLALQRAAARREGILRTPQELQAPLPPPERNAAPIYARLTRLLKEKPLDPATEKVRNSVGVRVAHTPAEIERVRRLLAERRDAMDLIHEAAGKPECVFRREWTRGMDLEYPEFAAMREAARLLTAESYFLAREGRYQEAVANQARALHAARHATGEAIVISQLVGMSLDSIALAGMESILSLAGPNAGVAETVRKAVADGRPRFHMRDALEGECVLFSLEMQQLRKGNLEAAARMGLPNGASPSGAPRRKPTPFERRVQGEAVDAMEAYTLSLMRPLIAGCEKPYPARKPFLKHLLNLDKPSKSNPVPGLGNVFVPVLAQAATRDVATRAKEEVVVAGAAVLAYKGRHGAFPDRLEQALPQPPPDPFSGGPLKYRREGSGFVVYSVGPDGNYDGRQETKRVPEHAYFRYPAAPQPPPHG